MDGPSGAGKSTISRLLASRLGFRYVDTGALYRALAWWVTERGLDPSEDGDLRVACEGFPIGIQWDDDGSMRVRCGSEDITRVIRAEPIGMLASQISARAVVRESLWRIQRELGERGGLVFEGRDMGSRVFPDADFRFFVTASLDERARRRFGEMRGAGETVSLEVVKEKMARRDAQDSSRAIAPLKVPDGAVVIDTTHLSPEQVVERIEKIIRGRRACC